MMSISTGPIKCVSLKLTSVIIPQSFFASRQNFDPFKRGLGLTIFGDGEML